MSITIDGVTYNVPFIGIDRKFDVLDKYAERTEDGVLHREPIGTYPNFDCAMGMSKNNVADYALLLAKLKEPVDFHEVTMPDETDGTITFDCYFANVRDSVVKWYIDDTTYYRGLTFSVIAKAPYWTP